MVRVGHILTAPALGTSGLTGAVGSSRWVGVTASTAPSTGTFLTGDWVLTLTGKMFVCTAGGSPGTWVEVGSGAAPGNMVTTDTTQTITGQKTVTNPAGLRATGNGNDSGIGFVLDAGVNPATNTRPGSPTVRFTARKDVGGTPSSGNLELTAMYLAAADASPTLVLGGFGGLRVAGPLWTFGMTGAQSGGRWVGMTDSAAPSSGTFVAGDWVIARDTGQTFICTAGGTPGTWTSAAPGNMVTTDTPQTITGQKTLTGGLIVNTVGITGNATIALTGTGSSSVDGRFTAQTFVPNGISGASNATRFVGGVASAAPTSGTFLLGDFVVSQTGKMFVCTVAGSPGTWVEVGSGAAPGNMVTTDTTQTITGAKTLSSAAGLLLSHIASPATPAAGLTTLFAKTSGRLFTKDPNGLERIVGEAIEAYPFAVTGTLTVRTGKSRIYLEGSYVIETVRAAVDTAPTGASVIVDVNKNGTTIYTTQSARPTIAASTFTATGNSPAVTTFVAGDYITVDVDQIGSTVAGSDLTVTVRLRRTA